MKRHASADELADLAAGVLKPRRAGKISAHLAGCAYCTDVNNQLANVSILLATVPAAPMPANLSSRIESVIAAESAGRLASEPTTEAGRRDLPARGSRPRRSGQGWRVPLLSGPAGRLVAAAGALVIIAGGGYEIAAHIGTASVTSTGSNTSGSSAVVPPGSRLSYGPNVTYHQASGTTTVRTVSSDTNFTGPTLGNLAVQAVKAEQVRGSSPGPSAGTISPESGAGAKATGSYSSGVPSGQRNTMAQSRDLPGCVDHLAGARRVLLVELARFDGQPATIIVIAATTVGSADVWAVRPTCSAANTELLDHVRVAHT